MSDGPKWTFIGFGCFGGAVLGCCASAIAGGGLMVALEPRFGEDTAGIISLSGGAAALIGSMLFGAAIGWFIGTRQPEDPTARRP